ncbi:MAG: VOC family protein [Saprospiraceae bacterium]|nr:VOC family protein [Saprospiraceae bacterium]
MLLEHIAINVPDSVRMADWYVKNCQMRVVIQIEEPPYTRFLADHEGKTCIEIYSNKEVPLPDYHDVHHLSYHQAFSVDDLEATKDHLIEQGATFVEEVNFPDGTRLIMLRDPWGIPLQLVKRSSYWY